MASRHVHQGSRRAFTAAACAVALLACVAAAITTAAITTADPAAARAGAARQATEPGAAELLDTPQRYVDPVFPAVTVSEGIGYATVTNVLGQRQRLRLDVYEPQGDTAVARPVILWLHGGSFQRGTRDLMSWWTRESARRGYVSVTATYRLEPEDDVRWARGITNATNDARAAVRWLRAHADEYRLDASRISMGGVSAGAVTSLQSAYSFVTPGGAHAGESSAISAAISLSGASAAIPDPGEPPAIMFHGSEDTVVGYDQTLVPGQGFDGVHTCERIRAAGVDCLFHTHHGAQHDITSYRDEDRDAALQFLSCRVGAPSPFSDATGRAYEHAAGWAVRSGLLAAGPRRFRGSDPLTRSAAEAAAWALLDRPTPSPTVPNRPDAAVTRGRFVTLLWRAAGSPDGAPGAGYVDVGNGVQADAADWAAAHGLLRGVGSRFSPTKPVDRGRAAVVLHRLALRAPAWSPALQAAPPSTVCFRVGDPATLG